MKTEKDKATKDCGTQTENESLNYVPPRILSGMQLSITAYPKFFTEPHMVLLLTSVCFSIGYYGFTSTTDSGEWSFVQNSKMGLTAACFAMIFYGALYFPSSIMQRPHYAFWRFILAGGIFYLMVLIFIFFQNKQDVLLFLKHFVDEKLGVPLPERSYADDCRVYTPENPNSNFANIKDALDMYISAHFFGWIFKMLIIRDWRFCMFLSIFFEFLEMTFQHWLPNFGECWWDHWILDVLLCNSGGILVGHYIIKHFHMKRFKWTRNSSVDKNIIANFKEFITRPQIDEQNWHIFSNTKRFYSVIYYILIVSAFDLSNFFNKYVLWIPPGHYVLAIRVFLLAFISIVTSREYYEYISNNKFLRLGPFLFLSHMIIFFEWAIFVKFVQGTGYFTEPFPKWIAFSWIGIFIFIIAVTIILMRRDGKKAFCPVDDEDEIEKKNN